MWDVAIVGAGPAGSAAALAALARKRDARVLVLDRSDFPRDKACGDGIAPHAVDILEQLGAPDAVAGFTPVHALRLGFATGRHVEKTMRRPAYVVPRKVFDARLLDAALAAGATFLRHRVRRVEEVTEGVVLDGAITARVLVAADGANSVVRRSLGLAPVSQRHVALAIRGYTPRDAVVPAAQVITFAERGWPAYAWSFPIGDGRANVGYGEVPAPGTTPTRAHLMSRLGALLPGADAGAAGWRAHHLPLSTARPRQPNGRVLFAGDSLSLINPLTGEGIYYAVLSGALAGAVAARPIAGDPGGDYRAALRRELGRHLRHTNVAARAATMRWVVDGALHAADHQHVFDDLVELGLGRGLLTARLITATLKATS